MWMGQGLLHKQLFSEGSEGIWQFDHHQNKTNMFWDNKSSQVAKGGLNRIFPLSEQ